MIHLLGKIGLAISTFFSLCPFPTIYTAFTKDSKVVQSLSLPGTISSLACCMLIGTFCAMNNFVECYLGCGLGTVSCMATLFTICHFNRDYFTMSTTVSILLVFAYCILNVFPPDVTEMIILVINTMACVAGPFDTADKLLNTKDPNYLHF